MRSSTPRLARTRSFTTRLALAGRSRRIPAPVAVLLALDLLFGALHLVGPYLPDALAEARFWNLNAERAVATWYATLQLSLIGILLLAYAAGRRGGPAKWAFGVAGLVALFMSLDEQTRLHERFARFAESTFGDTALERSGPWVLIVAPVFLLTVALVARGAREALRDRAAVARLFVAGFLLLRWGVRRHRGRSELRLLCGGAR